MITITITITSSFPLNFYNSAPIFSVVFSSPSKNTTLSIVIIIDYSTTTAITMIAVLYYCSRRYDRFKNHRPVVVLLAMIGTNI